MHWRLVQAFLGCVALEIFVVILAIHVPDAWMLSTWVSLGVIVVFSIMLAFLYVKVVDGGWGDLVDLDHVHVEVVDVPLDDGWSLVARVLTPREGIPPGERRPAVLCHHGLGGSHKKLLHLAVPLVLDGYIAVLPDARAHGESAARSRSRKDDWYITPTTGIVPDVHKIVDYIVSRDDVDPQRVVMMGTSMGGVACLTAGIADDRIKLAIPINPAYSISDMLDAPRGRVPLTEPWFMKHGLRFLIRFGKLRKLDDQMSPKAYIERLDAARVAGKVRLVHCMDDHLLLPEASAAKIVAALGLPGEHVMQLRRGDHSARGQETIILARVQRWLAEIFPRPRVAP